MLPPKTPEGASTQAPMADWPASGCSTFMPAGPSTFNSGMSCFSTAMTVCAPACRLGGLEVHMQAR